MKIYILTFVCGALYEITSVYWVLSVEKRKAFRAGFGSMVQAIVMLTGIGESINDVKAAVCFVVGYSFGSIAGIIVEQKYSK